MDEITLVANLRTGLFKRSRPEVSELSHYIEGEDFELGPPDWDCGHFLTIRALLEKKRP